MFRRLGPGKTLKNFQCISFHVVFCFSSLRDFDRHLNLMGVYILSCLSIFVRKIFLTPVRNDYVGALHFVVPRYIALQNNVNNQCVINIGLF